MSNLADHKFKEMGRPQLTLEKKVLITVLYLGNQESVRSIADRFGVTKFSVFKCVREICTSIVRNLMPKSIKWPTYTGTLPSVETGFLTGLSFSRLNTYSYQSPAKTRRGLYQQKRPGFEINSSKWQI